MQDCVVNQGEEHRGREAQIHSPGGFFSFRPYLLRFLKKEEYQWQKVP
jgi:hypothetical protein